MSANANMLVKCPNCKALYKVVRLEKAVQKQPICRDCGAPLQARAGRFVLKYSLVRSRASRASGLVSRRGSSVMKSRLGGTSATGGPRS